MLEKEFQYYIHHQAELVEKYDGQFIVIVNQEVVGAYPTRAAAYDATVLKQKPGEFLIQKCGPGEQSYTQIYHSRIAI